MMRSLSHWRWLIALVTLALVATACTQGSTNGTGTVAVNGAASHPLTVSPATTITTLAGAGVATVADETATSPQTAVTGATVLRITAWQADNMTREAAAHGGILGADLNSMLPMPGAPPLDYLIAAWSSAKADPAEIAAAQLLGPQNWLHADQVVFPTEVLELFVADALQHVTDAPGSTGVPSGSSQPSAASTIPSAAPSGATTGPSAPSTGSAPAPGSSGSAAPSTGSSEDGQQLAAVAANSAVNTPCSTIANFVESVLRNIFDRLKLDPDSVDNYISGKLGGGTVAKIVGGLFGWAASWWNHAVDLAEAATKAVISSLTAPVINLLQIVIGGLATITMIASYLKAWTAPITASPDENRFSVGAESPIGGTFTVTIDPNAEITDWPPQFVDCAAAAGVPLPSLSKEGLPVKWTYTEQEDGLAAFDGATDSTITGKLDKKLSDSISYTTGHEASKKGIVVAGGVTVTAGVRRTEVDQLRAFVTAWAEDKFPNVIRPVTDPIIAHFVELATEQLDKITAVEGSATIAVTHHIPKPPKPTPSGGCSGTTIPAGTYSGPFTATLTSKLHIAIAGPTKPLGQGGGTSTMHGQITITSNGTTVTGTMTGTATGTEHIGQDGSVIVHGTQTGALSARISGPASAPRVDGSMTGTVDTYDAPVINAHNKSTSPLHAGLHVTGVTCTSVSGDLLAMMREVMTPVAQYVSVSGVGGWTIPRT